MVVGLQHVTAWSKATTRKTYIFDFISDDVVFFHFFLWQSGAVESLLLLQVRNALCELFTQRLRRGLEHIQSVSWIDFGFTEQLVSLLFISNYVY